MSRIRCTGRGRGAVRDSVSRAHIALREAGLTTTSPTDTMIWTSLPGNINGDGGSCLTSFLGLGEHQYLRTVSAKAGRTLI